MKDIIVEMSAYYELVAGGGGDDDEDDPAVLAAQAQAGQQLDAARRVHGSDIGAGGDANRGGRSGVGDNSALCSAIMVAENRRLGSLM